MKIIQKILSVFLIISALLILIGSRKTASKKLEKRSFKTIKMYLFSIIMLLATWLISKSSEYNGLEYILLMLSGFILIIKAWLLARSKILDSIVNLIAKLSIWQIKLIALFQIAIAWILLT